MISHRWKVEEERGAYTWLRERESGERLKASDEGAGIEERRQRSRDWRPEANGGGGM
jgi:hypothetical protein